jgi:hypothetical protein
VPANEAAVPNRVGTPSPSRRSEKNADAVASTGFGGVLRTVSSAARFGARHFEQLELDVDPRTFPSE